MKIVKNWHVGYISCLTIHPAKEEPLETSENSLPSCGEAVDELFVTTFNSIRDTATDSINKICDFTGKLSNSFVLTSLSVLEIFYLIEIGLPCYIYLITWLWMLM